jgi:hypothetical protein
MMSGNPTFFGLALTDWAAIATIVNGLTVLILVVINVLYLKSANRQAEAALRQAEAALAQAKEGQRQADAASESLRLLKGQLSEQNHRDLLRAIAILDEMKLDVMFWADITDNKWGMAPETVHLLPDDWSVILLQAGRVSLDLRKETLEAFRMIGNAQYQISSFLSRPQNYRDAQLMPPAHGNLVNAMPKLNQIWAALQLVEEKASASAGPS